MRRFRNVPPLQYLIGFEAAARLGSFSAAALELGLSQSAISHEMRLLEARIGQPLFIRQGRSIKLTDAGRDYQKSVNQSLDQLENGYRRLAPFRKPGSVIIYTPRDFGARWLLPRLHDLKRAVPDCDPWIDTGGSVVDFDSMEVSIAIVRAIEPDQKWLSMKLVHDRLAPVMSPMLLPDGFPNLDDLQSYTLLHDERSETWADWCEGAGVTIKNHTAGLDFSDSDFALQAAEIGLGIALASLPLVEMSLQQKKLIQPFAFELETQQSWYALTAPKELNDPFTRQVWEWLAQQCDTRTSTSHE